MVKAEKGKVSTAVRCTQLKAPALLLMLFADCAFAQSADPNAVLVQLTEQDQAARSGSKTDIDWTKVAAEDAARRARVLDLIRQGGVRTAEDYCNAALIFQHGDTTDEIRLAHSLATTSRALDPTSKRCKWLSAASWDRLMMRLNKPQWYGTQFTKSGDGNWQLYETDEAAVSDADRAALGVPSLAESKERAEKLPR